MSKKISIVMAYYNRKEQLEFTLKTIADSNYKNKEVIIVDDASDDDQRIESLVNNFLNLDIKIIRINEIDKKHINSCIPYNVGIKNASGEIIVIQNPEVCHIGDCLTLIAMTLKENEWLTFNCYGLGTFNDNKELISLYSKTSKKIEDIKSFIDIKYKGAGNSANFTTEIDNIGGWLNHHKWFYRPYHYLGAIKKDTLDKIGGGFCELYKDGFCAEDDDFLATLIYHNIKFKTPNFNELLPFAIHLRHKSSSNSFNKNEKRAINFNILKQRLHSMNFDNGGNFFWLYIARIPKAELIHYTS